MITQTDLQEIFIKRLALEKAVSKLNLYKADIADMESRVIKLLKNRESVEKGSFNVRLDTKKGRASVQWKSIVESLKGELYVATILSKAERKDEDVLVVDKVPE